MLILDSKTTNALGNGNKLIHCLLGIIFIVYGIFRNLTIADGFSDINLYYGIFFIIAGTLQLLIAIVGYNFLGCHKYINIRVYTE